MSKLFFSAWFREFFVFPRMSRRTSLQLVHQLSWLPRPSPSGGKCRFISKCARQHEKEPRSNWRRWGWVRWAVRVQAYHSEDAIPLCHIHNNPQEEQLLPSVHAQISILFCTPLSIIAAFFPSSLFLGGGGAGDVEIEAARD